jgi:DNA transposition AAA+ family ATPase
MGLSEQQRQDLERTLPSADATRVRLRNYLSRAGMTLVEFGRAVNYSESSINQFLGGTYDKVAGSDFLLRQAIEQGMEMYPLAPETGDADEPLYETENVDTIRRWFEFTLGEREMAYLYGAPGSQKTFVLKHLIAQHNLREMADSEGTRAYYVYCSQNLRPLDLLAKMCQACGAVGSRRIQGMMRALRYELRNRRTLFVFDEGQHLSIDCLEVIRELNDEEPHIGVLIAGSHQLLATFKQRAAELEQWNSRLAAGIELPGIGQERALAIVRALLPTASDRQVKRLVSDSRVPDAYKGRGSEYISARRLFKSIRVVLRDPRFRPQAQAQKASA